MAKDGVPKFPASHPPEEVAPVYLLYGDEDLLAEEALDALVESVLAGADRGFNLDVLRGGETGGREIIDRACSFPMVSDRRVVVVREAEKLGPHDLEIVAAYIEQPSPSTCLILASVKPDLRKKPFMTLKKKGVALEFKRLFERQIPGWISDRVARSGRHIDDSGARLLAAYLGTSLREVQNEIDKLCIFVGDRKEITEEDVSALVGISRELSPFELQKAIGRCEAGRALTILERMLDAGEGVPLIVAVLTNYFLTLWKLHDLQRRGVPEKEHAAQARVSPYFLAEYYAALENHPSSACERALLLLAEADEQSKSGVWETRQVMAALVIRLSRGDERNIRPGVVVQ